VESAKTAVKYGGKIRGRLLLLFWHHQEPLQQGAVQKPFVLNTLALKVSHGFPELKHGWEIPKRNWQKNIHKRGFAN
jgi:hypothetical protein